MFSLFLVVVFFLLKVFVMVGVAFLTLLERSVWGYIHIRKGPNSVGFVGIFQPFSDAICYLLGSSIFLWFLIIWFIIFLLFWGFFLSLLVWVLIPYLSGFISFELGLLFFFFFFWLVQDLVFMRLWLLGGLLILVIPY